MARYVTYESLLMTGRAVKATGKWLRVHPAGEDPEVYWLEFPTKALAIKAGRSVLIHIREKIARGEINTDHMYNNVFYSWFERLRDGGYIQNLKEAANEENTATSSGTGHGHSAS